MEKEETPGHRKNYRRMKSFLSLSSLCILMYRGLNNKLQVNTVLGAHGNLFIVQGLWGSGRGVFNFIDANDH